MGHLRGDHWCNEASRLMRERDEARNEVQALRSAAQIALEALAEPGADGFNRREAADRLREALA